MFSEMSVILSKVSRDKDERHGLKLHVGLFQRRLLRNKDERHGIKLHVGLFQRRYNGTYIQACGH